MTTESPAPAAPPPRLRVLLPRLFAIDLRSLALFRALLGAILFVDLCGRLGVLQAFYSDAGVFPRGRLAAADTLWRISLHAANGQTVFELALLLLALAAALALFAGWRTRAAAIVSFVLYVSLLDRVPIIVGGSDMLLAALLFWACFLPLNAHWSVDAAQAADDFRPPADPHLSRASAALLVQVALVFLLCTWRAPGADPLAAALAQPDLLGPTAWWLRQQLSLPGWTHTAALVAGGIGPLLLFAPLATRGLRALGLLALILLQVAAILLFDLGTMPWLGLIALTPFLGAGFWNLLAPRPRTDPPLRIYRDESRPRSLRAQRLLRVFLILPQAQLLTAQSQARTATLLRANRSWIVIDHDDRAWMGWNALAILLRHSPLFRPLGAALWRLPLSALGDPLYRLLVRCGPGRERTPRPAGMTVGRRTDAVAGIVLALVVLWNLAPVAGLPSLQTILAPPLRLLRLDQHWNRFLPSGPSSRGWFLAPGTLDDGDRIDAMREGTPLRFDPPAVPSQRQGGRLWRTYRNRLLSPRGLHDRALYARYLCRRWNAGALAGSRLQNVEIVYALIRPHTRDVEQHVLWQQDCRSGMGSAPDG